MTTHTDPTAARVTRLLAFGDLHLGAGGQYGRTPDGRLIDQVHVLEQIATLAFERDVGGVLFAGDAFEGPGVPPEQLQLFAAFVAGLRALEIPILAITGNGKHDAAVRKTNGLAIFNHIEGITIAAQPAVYRFAGCDVATLPWVHPGRLIARAGRDVPRDEVNAIAAELLVDVARDLRQECGSPAILLGHWSVSGAALPAGLPVDQLREPVLPIDDLEMLGFDHLVFGHIHRPQTLGTTGFYTGSPMPLNFGEEREGHGVCILHVGEREEIDFPGAEFVPIDSPRFITLKFDHEDVAAQIALSSNIGWSLPDDAVVRVQVVATQEQWRNVDAGRLRNELVAAGARIVKVEPTIVREQRARVAGLDESLDELAALDAFIQANQIDTDLAAAMRAKTREYMDLVA